MAPLFTVPFLERLQEEKVTMSEPLDELTKNNLRCIVSHSPVAAIKIVGWHDEIIKRRRYTLKVIEANDKFNKAIDDIGRVLKAAKENKCLYNPTVAPIAAVFDVIDLGLNFKESSFYPPISRYYPNHFIKFARVFWDCREYFHQGIAKRLYHYIFKVIDAMKTFPYDIAFNVESWASAVDMYNRGTPYEEVDRYDTGFFNLTYPVINSVPIQDHFKNKYWVEGDDIVNAGRNKNHLPWVDKVYEVNDMIRVYRVDHFYTMSAQVWEGYNGWMQEILPEAYDKYIWYCQEVERDPINLRLINLRDLAAIELEEERNRRSVTINQWTLDFPFKEDPVLMYDEAGEVMEFWTESSDNLSDRDEEIDDDLTDIGSDHDV